MEREDKDGLLACAKYLPELESRPRDAEGGFDGPRSCNRYAGRAPPAHQIRLTVQTRKSAGTCSASSAA